MSLLTYVVPLEPSLAVFHLSNSYPGLMKAFDTSDAVLVDICAGIDPMPPFALNSTAAPSTPSKKTRLLATGPGLVDIAMLSISKPAPLKSILLNAMFPVVYRLINACPSLLVKPLIEGVVTEGTFAGRPK